jgi:anti-sigma B factor antagonist
MGTQMNLLTVSTEKRGPFTIITLSGELDHSSADLVLPHLEAVQSTSPHVIFDLTALEFMDSSGLHLLGRAYNITRAYDGTVALVAPVERVRRVLDVSGFTKQLAVYPTLDLALSACNSPPTP